MDILDGVMMLKEEKDLELLKQKVMDLTQDLYNKGLMKDSYIYETSDIRDALIAEWNQTGKINTWKMEQTERWDFFMKVDLLVTKQFYEEILKEKE